MKKVVVILGNGAPAIGAGNVYLQRLSDQYELFFVEQSNLAVSNIVRTIKRYFKRYGLLSLLNMIILRLYMMLCVKSTVQVAKFENALSVVSLNNGILRKFIASHKPDVILTTGCGILGKKLLKSITVPIINAHCGVCPRYRGMGNIWALVENNTDLLGTTIHYVDEGIDTGSIIGASKLQITETSAFEDLDQISMIQGANMICDFLETGSSDSDFDHESLEDGYYSYPGITHYFGAKTVYIRRFKEGA